MSKYIDADKLIAYLKKTMESYKSQMVDPAKYPIDHIDLMAFLAREYQALIENITSLQQEQPEPTCKSCGFYENNCPFIRNNSKPYPNRVCKDYTYSVMKEQEQPEVDLVKALDNYYKMVDFGPSDAIEYEIHKDIARHFYELGLNARKED